MSWKNERIYIAVKTYPTISERYAELVCTAGVREDGSWIRLYPVPFRLLSDDQKYSKYTWINAYVEKNTSDFRLESYRPDLSTIVVEPKPKIVDWKERREILFKNKEVFTNKEKLVAAAKRKENPISLALFKPTEIVDFIIKPDSREWDAEKIENLYAKTQQLNLFLTKEQVKEEFRLVKKIPYKFYYCFKDDAGETSTLMIEDWEIGMLYLHCLERADGDEQKACADVKKKYFDYFSTLDIYLILGTTKSFHNVSPNPFIIIGVFYPPKQRQLSLFG